MSKTIFNGCFFVVSTLNILALVFSMDLVFTVTKPLIVLVLMTHYARASANRSTLFLFALFFCLAGDVFLLFVEKNELFFMCGLLAFLVGHILYIITYRQHQQTGMGEELLSTQKIRFALPVVLAGTGLITVLYSSLGSLQIPVMIYAIVLMIMVIVALHRYGKTTAASYWQVLFGALLFMISDSMLAINKFLHPFNMASVSIMIPYIAAQYLIVHGILAHHVRK
jgi:uncharacterized membrane protein YhhN